MSKEPQPEGVSMEFWVLFGVIALVLTAKTLLEDHFNPKCPKCQIRDSRGVEHEIPHYVRNSQGNLSFPIAVQNKEIIRGRVCNGCKTYFNSRWYFLFARFRANA